MKARLPKLMMMALMAGSAAYASGTYRPQAIVTVESGTVYADTCTIDGTDTTVLDELQASQYAGNSTEAKSLVKDGQGTLVIDTSTKTTVNGEEVVTPSSEALKANNPILVREGTVNVSNTTIQNYNALSDGVSNLSVGGKNAVLNLNNAHYEQRIEYTSNYGSSINIGTGDGAGTVNLTYNSTLHTDHCLFIGRTNTVYEGTPVYVQPSYEGVTGDAVYEYVAEPPASEVNISGGSKMSAGTQIMLDNAVVTIDGAGSALIGAERAIDEPTVQFYSTYIGSNNGAQSTVKVTNGGEFTLLRGLLTGYGENSTANIEVSGEGSCFTVRHSTVDSHTVGKSSFLGVAASSTANITISDNAKMQLADGWVYLGYDGSTAVITIEKTASLEQLDAASPAGICMYEENAKLVNRGTVGVDTFMYDGVFTMEDGAVAASLTATTAGSIYIQGDTTFTGDVAVGGETRLTFDLGSTMNLDGCIFSFDGGTIYVELGSVNADGLTTPYFTLGYTEVGAIDIAEGTKIQLMQNGVAYGEAVELVVGTNVATKIIPEPATVTLSLLALAGLAARRRRQR